MAETLHDPGSASRGFLEDLPRFFRVLRRDRGVILLVASLCLALAAVYLYLSPPLYEATTRLLVLRQGKSMSIAPGGVDAGPAPEGDGVPQEDFIPTQIAIVRSPEVVKRAIDTVGLDNIPTLKRSVKGGKDPAHAAIEKYLKVSRPEKLAKVIQIDYRAGSEDEAVRLLEAITKSYREFLVDHYQREGQIVAVIGKARGELNGELAEAERKYTAFRQKHPLVSTDKDGRSLLMGRLERWDRAGAELRVREVQLRGQFELGRKLAQERVGLWAIAHITGQLAGDWGDKNGLLAYSSNVTQMTSWDYVKQLSLEQQQLAERYGPQYSKVQEIQEQIARIQERVRNSRSGQEQADIKDLLKALEQGLKASEAMRAELDKGFTADKALESDFMEEARLRNEVERRLALFHAAIAQFKQAEIARDFESINTEAVEAPNVPEHRLWRRYLQVPLLASLFGLAAGAALVLAREKLRPHLHSEAEVREALGLAVVGRLPTLGGRPAVGAGRAAGSRDNERVCAGRHINLALLRRHRPDLKVVLVASPRRGDGTTYVASHLAVSLAQAGQRTLLIDANLRQPFLAPLLALAGDRGLTQVLQGERPASQTIQRSPVENLDVIAAGPEAADSTALLLSPRLKDVLNGLRSPYDAVILDTPAVLEAPDACILACLADGVLLVVRDGVTVRGDAEEAVRLLRGLDVPLLGAVFNAAWGPETDAAGHIADLIASAGWHGAGATRREGRERAGAGAERSTAPSNPRRLNHVPQGVRLADIRAPRDPAGNAKASDPHLPERGDPPAALPGGVSPGQPARCPHCGSHPGLPRGPGRPSESGTGAGEDPGPGAACGDGAV
jgi:capsular exopolysaccharide synthesis family protein